VTLCPDCGAEAIPVLWGMPAAESLRAAELGLLHIGGCIVRGDAHSTWRCPTCEAVFAGPDTTGALDAARDSVGS
jgi:rubredoxin